MKTRRHHNNRGLHQIKAGKTPSQVKALAKRLGIIYCVNDRHGIPCPLPCSACEEECK